MQQRGYGGRAVAKCRFAPTFKCPNLETTQQRVWISGGVDLRPAANRPQIERAPPMECFRAAAGTRTKAILKDNTDVCVILIVVLIKIDACIVCVCSKNKQHLKVTERHDNRGRGGGSGIAISSLFAPRRRGRLSSKARTRDNVSAFDLEHALCYM